MNLATHAARDPLLLIAKIILYVLMAGLVLGALGVSAGGVGMAFFTEEIAAEFASSHVSFDFAEVRLAMVGALVLIVVLLAMITAMLWLLKRIIDTVGEGDPFVPINATRMTIMAWLSLAVQIVALPLAGLATWIHNVTEMDDMETAINFDSGFDGNGILLMLVLFILARVFRKGAEMREELEGTV
ncbi:DUF2975 domain-containing protein [Novosphingobium sp. BW1]|uniref:DUF2975 domain-containing protein n=1 Tax=Novosphingobium sp. BW1 TaxID=2592621 RepID=UPI0011DEBF83|nr:DUF2975 domain-containing protein [Novosphingobium sp. BW1]TYC89355.1 DUF2975 domain-containing protein [Novosphingobium sp. BW1]